MQINVDEDAYRILKETRDKMIAGGIRASFSDAVRALEENKTPNAGAWHGRNEGLRELDRMRKIAACFRAGDRHKMVLISQCLFPDDWIEMIERLQEAAKLAEGGA